VEGFVPLSEAILMRLNESMDCLLRDIADIPEFCAVEALHDDHRVLRGCRL
jgi:hypothetical protein